MKHTLPSLLFSAFTMIAAVPVAAQPTDVSSVIAVRLNPGESIALDGTLSDPAWQRAPVFHQFVEKDPTLGAAPSHETRVQVLFDDHAVYVGVTALDPQPDQIRAPLVRHDGVLRTQDFVVLYLDPIGNRRSAQFFRVSASGSTADGMHTASDDSEDFSPDFDFDAAAKRNERGYTAVLRVPFASLRFTGEAKAAQWRMMVARRIPRDQFYLTTSVLVPRESPSFISTMQPLDGIALPKASTFLTLRPSMTARHKRTQDAGMPREQDTKVQATLDLKWRPVAELVIDGTLRPDFSQIDLDVPQLGGNSRYALFYPEKRPFFFEASDLLRSPTDALYTRSFTEPAWGIRATWRGKTLAGTAIAVDDRGGGLTLLPGAYGTDVANQPASRTLALRELSELGSLQAGAMLAARRYDDARGENLVFGPDVGWQVTDQVRLRAQWLHSRTTAQSDGAGGLQQGPTTEGNHVYLRTTHQTDRTYTDVELHDVGQGFRNDTGFVNQAGIRKLEAEHRRSWRQLGPLNELAATLYLDHTRDRITGETIKTDVTPSIWLSATRNTQASLELHGWSALRTAPHAPLLRERYVYGKYSTTPTPWIPVVEASLSIGRIADVVANAVRPGVQARVMARMRALPQFEFEPRFSFANLERDGKQTYREAVTQLKGIWFFNANNNLRVIVQRKLLDRRAEPGIAELHNRSQVASVTYTWRRSAGTVLYVGASHARHGTGSASRGSEVFVKLQVDADDVKALF